MKKQSNSSNILKGNLQLIVLFITSFYQFVKNNTYTSKNKTKYKGSAGLFSGSDGYKFISDFVDDNNLQRKDMLSLYKVIEKMTESTSDKYKLYYVMGKKIVSVNQPTTNAKLDLDAILNLADKNGKIDIKKLKEYQQARTESKTVEQEIANMLK